ncbi:Mechanosensitive ion channel [Desulfonema limicola]|uniref:Mechanosensitive ion channel n=1 Tax=Desulfonema limicola TaxID=45656 RepID=A0A975GH23_9BACT|nr:mechanosensitive ion channel domain-containing protein [Desulfonema limicola]QTA80834.1 Mechanosensitive ion channel [Desulfonema limicola]
MKQMYYRLNLTGFILFMFIMFFFSTAQAQEIIDNKDIQTQQQETGAETGGEYAKLMPFIEMSLKMENKNIEDIKKEQKELKENSKDLANEINGYKVQLSKHINLLHLPQTKIEDLEQALIKHRKALENIDAYLINFKQKQTVVLQRLAQTEEQYTFNEKQIYEISIEGGNTALDAQVLVENIQMLIRVLSVKINELEWLDEYYKTNIKQLQELRDELSQFTEKFIQDIEERKKIQLFTRKDNPLEALNYASIKHETNLLTGKIKELFTLIYWQKLFSDVWNSRGVLFFSVIILFITAFFAIIKINRYYPVPEIPETGDMTWYSFINILFRRSLLLFVSCIFLYFFSTIHQLYKIIPFTQAAYKLMIIILFTRWAALFMSLWLSQNKQKNISAQLISSIISGIRIVRYFALIHVVMEWLLGENSVIIVLIRIFFDFVLIIGCVNFWKRLKADSHDDPDITFQGFSLYNIIEKLTYIIFLGGLVSELIGYGFFAVYWYASWGRTIITLIWGGLIFMVFREWKHNINLQPETDESQKKHNVTVKRFCVRLCWPVWFICFIISLIVAWGGRQSVIINSLAVLNHPVQIGSITINLMGFVYAFLTLSLFHLAMQIWKHDLINKVFPDDKFEMGLKSSINSIITYVVWAVAIIISLSFIGFSTASLTVVFGALSVGLGFGLQNIFNNFVSGIILLFERPIQVGDIVEVNGIWGEIKNINIRSTQVQTYDNASLIIPNSEFISSQVTNWSFKDMRIRRKLNIGVAYGSDIELVRKLLIEIAKNTENVLLYPEPNIVFQDFGDSALIFVLRYWTHLDYFFSTQTDIFFEVDRLFKENNIEIPFPQRDVYIRSMVNAKNDIAE